MSLPEPQLALDEDEPQTFDAVPVVADSREILPAAPLSGQAVAVAATSFVAGIATLALVHRRKVRRSRRKLARSRGSRAQQLGRVVSTQSFLIDIHFIER